MSGARHRPVEPSRLGIKSKFFKPEFGSVSQVGVTRENTSVNPLYLWERARVRAVFKTVG
ncbi:hypothetical protein EMIT0347P_40500 [Pseudomonas sp. IT-347P]